MQLFINSQPCVIKTGTSISLTRENPLITESGDWSLDVVLPFNGCLENIRALGSPLHRPELPLASWVGRRLPFRLTAMALRVEGDALVTSATQEEVKVQLVAGRSSLNLYLLDEGEKEYIDRLLLGRLLDNVVWEPGADPNDTATYNIVPGNSRLNNIANRLIRDERAAAEKNLDTVQVTDAGYPYDDPDTYDAVIMPTKCADGMVNEKAFYTLYDGGRTKWTRFLTPYIPFDLKGNMFRNFNVSEYQPEIKMALQPRMAHTLERVLAAVGFTVADNVLRRAWTKDLYIVNTICTEHLARMLPHWTVREFLEECRRFFGIEYLVDGRTVSIVNRRTYMQALSTLCLEEVFNETEATLDEKGEGLDTSASNVEYEGLADDAPMLCLPSDIFEKAEPRLATKAEIDAMEPDGNLRRIFVCTDSTPRKLYAFLKPKDSTEYEIQEVDLLPPRSSHGVRYSTPGRTADISLRIRPALTERVWFAGVYAHEGSSSSSGQYSTEAGMTDIPVARQPYSDEYEWTVNEEINPSDSDSDEETDKSASDNRPDRIELAMTAYGGGIYHSVRLYEEDNGDYTPAGAKTTFGVKHVKNPDTGMYEMTTSGTDYFQLTGSDHYSVGGFALQQPFAIDTRLVRRFQFIDTLDNYDPTAIYIIRGRKYICQKIELTITEKGIDPVKTGYFHELNE